MSVVDWAKNKEAEEKKGIIIHKRTNARGFGACVGKTSGAGGPQQVTLISASVVLVMAATKLVTKNNSYKYRENVD